MNTFKKALFVLGLATAASAVASEGQLQQRLDEMEARLAVLEEALHNKLDECKLAYHYYGSYLDQCPNGTFAKTVRNVGSGTISLECGYYKLSCVRKQPE